MAVSFSTHSPINASLCRPGKDSGPYRHPVATGPRAGRFQGSHTASSGIPTGKVRMWRPKRTASAEKRWPRAMRFSCPGGITAPYDAGVGTAATVGAGLVPALQGRPASRVLGGTTGRPQGTPPPVNSAATGLPTIR